VKNFVGRHHDVGTTPLTWSPGSGKTTSSIAYFPSSTSSFVTNCVSQKECYKSPSQHVSQKECCICTFISYLPFGGCAGACSQSTAEGGGNALSVGVSRWLYTLTRSPSITLVPCLFKRVDAIKFQTYIISPQSRHTRQLNRLVSYRY